MLLPSRATFVALCFTCARARPNVKALLPWPPRCWDAESAATAPRCATVPRATLARAGVLVVGGGPAGYATAMALAQHGFTDIRILERAPSARYYNPGKALAYALFATAKNTLRRLGMDGVDDLGACPGKRL